MTGESHLALCTAVHHSRVLPLEKSTLVNETKWQYYGTPGTAGNLTLTWNPQTLRATHVNIEVWGYNETGNSATIAVCAPKRTRLAH